MAAIDLTLGIAVGQSQTNITQQVGEILKNVGAEATPLKITLDKNSFRGDVAELQAILRNMFRTAGVELSGLQFMGGDLHTNEYVAQVRAITSEVSQGTKVVGNLSTLLSKTFTKPLAGLRGARAQISAMKPEIKDFLTLLNNLEARFRNQATGYFSKGGADEATLNKITVAYQQLSEMRANTLKGIKLDDEADKATGVTYAEKYQGMIQNIREVESEVRNLNSQLAETERAERNAFSFDRSSAVKTLYDMQANIDKARTNLSGAGSEMVQRFDAELIDVRARLDDVRVAVESGSVSYDTYKESVAEASLKLSELKAALAAASTPNAVIDPTSEMAAEGESALTKLIARYHEVSAEYQKLISGTDLGGGVGAGFFGEIPEKERELLSAMGALRSHKMTVGELSAAIGNATRNLEAYKTALTNISDIKQEGAYNILGGGAEENKARSTAATLQTELSKVEAAGGSLRTRFSKDLQDVIAEMESLSAGFGRSGVEATKYAAAMDNADAVLNRLKEAQAAAAAPEAIIETDTAAYRNERAEIEKLISSLNSLEKKYLTLGHISTGDFVTGTGVSFDAVRNSANELLTVLNAGVQTNGGAVSGRSWVSQQTQELGLYIQEMTNAAAVQKNLMKVSEEYRSLVGKGMNVTKQWTAAKFAPETAQSYNAVSQAVKNLNASYDEFVHNPDAPGAFDKINASLKENGQVIEENTNRIRIFGKDYGSVGTKIGEKFKTLLTYTIGARVIYGAIRKMRELVTEAVNLDSAMGQLRIVTNEAESAYKRFGETAGKTARELGVSIKDLIDATTTYSRLGYSLDESSVLSKYTAMLSKVGDIDASTAQSAVTSMIKAFNIDATSVDDIERMMDKLVVVGRRHCPGLQ